MPKKIVTTPYGNFEVPYLPTDEEINMSQYSPEENPNKYPETQAATPDNTYSLFVGYLIKPGINILESWGIHTADITPEAAQKISMLHAVVGISGEAGELLDAVKKFCIYNKPLDEENIKEELGDIKFYIQALVNEIESLGTLTDFSDSALERANRKKLDKRYKNGYSDKAAQERVDKTEVPITSRISRPSGWDELILSCHNTVIGCDMEWLSAQCMTASTQPDKLNYLVREKERMIYFCMDHNKLEKFARDLVLGE